MTVGAGCNSSIAALWLPSMQAACDRWQINNRRRVAAFLANVGVESNGLQVLVENLNYSAQGLAATWDRYSATGKKGGPANSLAQRLNRNPQAIANNVYANRMGNGDEASGDGWKYRGQGPIQITGADNLKAFFAAMGLPLDTDPAKLQQPDLGSESAAWFFAARANCNPLADADQISNVVKAINGQLPCPANQGDLRKSRYSDVLKLI